MRKVSDIIDLWPRGIDLARDLGVWPSRITDWKNRNAIPAQYWKDLLASAERRHLRDITVDLLVEIHAGAPEAGLAPGFHEEESPAFAGPTGASIPLADAERESGHFSRHRGGRRARFQTAREIEDHVDALREEGSHR